MKFNSLRMVLGVPRIDSMSIKIARYNNTKAIPINGMISSYIKYRNSHLMIE